MEIWGKVEKGHFFPRSTHDFPNFLVGGGTLHKCCILQIRFDQFFKGNLVGALKLIVLFDNFYQVYPKIRAVPPCFGKISLLLLFFHI